jgi:NAD(P)-dependent dehydrogenase (short-subunit alcohol dehydrogenase family)
MGKLQGKVAVITGGSTGIGLATAKLFAAEGASVVIMGRRQRELDEAVAAIGERATGICGDIAQLTDIDALYAAIAPIGKVDVIVANAGVGEFATLESATQQQFDKTFNVNVRGTFFTVQKALPHLNEGASIIIVGSVAGVKGSPGFSLYGASKAAIRNFVRGWALELKDRGIRSNVLSPGPIDTAILDGIPQEALERIVGSIPLGRLGRPEEVAKAALFLASDDSSFVTGIELFVDGGRAQV